MKHKEENGNTVPPSDANAKAKNGGSAGNAEPAAEGEIVPEALVDVGPEPDSPEAILEAVASADAAPTSEQLEIAGLKDRLLRLQADFDNFRKRTNREREDLQKRAGEAVLTDLIPILDNLEFGIQQALKKPGGETFAEGLTLIQTQLMETCKKHGLEVVDANGKAFDPNLHEAVAYVPSKEAAEGHVLAQSRRGYRLGEKLLRPAMVVVSGGADGKKGGEG